MGYLFENMEKMDIQAERQNTKNAKEETLSELQDIMGLDNAQAWEKIEAYWK